MLFVETSNVGRKTGDPAVTSPLPPFWERICLFTSGIGNHLNREGVFRHRRL